MDNLKQNRSQLYAGLVWIISSFALITYGLLSYLNIGIPGIEETVAFLGAIDERYIYLTAFIAIFIEGLYVIGNFFPGASLVALLAIISQTSGWLVFVATVLLIFVGWCLAGFVNIWIAQKYKSKIADREGSKNYLVKDRLLTTWFPSIRSSYEVAQVAEGVDPRQVLISSLKVRFWATLFMGGIALVIPLLFDINQIGAREGYTSIIIVAVVCMIVGVVKIKRYQKVRFDS